MKKLSSFIVELYKNVKNCHLSLQCVPVTWDALPQTHYTFLAMNVVMWISLLVASQKDPGFLAQNTDEYHK